MTSVDFLAVAKPSEHSCPFRLEKGFYVDGKHHSLKDVAAAGGWKDTETLLTCYQQPDADTLLAVMSEPKKMRDAALASG